MRRIGSLYSGIAGLELGILAAYAEAGLPAQVAWQCEIDSFCTRVLAHHFPNAERFLDVATVSHPPIVDVLCGGFSCQDVSGAGKGAGLGRETRSGFTLHHLLRIVDEIKPRFLAIENVTSGAKRWLPQVVQELVDRDYRPRAVPLGAIDVGAPHRRLRVFVVADRQRTGLEEQRLEQARGQLAPAERGGGAGGRALADPDGAASRGLGSVRDGERTTPRDDAGGRSRRGQPLAASQRDQLREQPGRSGGTCRIDSIEPRVGSTNVGDAAEQGRAWSVGTGGPGSPLIAERSDDAGRDGGPPQPGVGGVAYGLPFDVARHAFPAGRGQAQYEWEAARVVASDVKVTDRPAKLRALGNAVLPQCGLVVGRILIAMGA